MKTKVGENRGSAQPPAHDHNVIHTKRILPEAHRSHQLDRDCSAGRDSPICLILELGCSPPCQGRECWVSTSSKARGSRNAFRQGRPHPRHRAGPRQGCESLRAPRGQADPPPCMPRGTRDRLKATFPGSEPRLPTPTTHLSARRNPHFSCWGRHMLWGPRSPPVWSLWWCESPRPASALYTALPGWGPSSAPESESPWPVFTLFLRRGWYL